MSKNLSIAISSIGRFHMFDLARQMLQLRQKVKFVTGYPSFKVDHDLRAITLTRSFWVVLNHLRSRVPIVTKTNWWSHRALEDFGPWLARTLDFNEIDILDALAGTGWEAGRVLKGLEKPWICNRGSTHILTQKRLLEEEHERWGIRPPFFGLGMERALGEYDECDAIVVPSEFTRRSFIKEGIPANRVFKCPYGVDLSLFHNCSLKKGNDKLRVVFLGHCSIRKGIGYLLQALRPLVRQGAVETWLIGGVAPEARLILAAHEGEFVFQGHQPRAKLAEYLSRCDVLVLPSIEEGLALVMAQAMACGLPVIATTNTGAEDLLTDGVEGFIIPIRAPQVIREKIQWLLDNPDQRRVMGAAALKRVKSLGGWAEYGKRSLAIYHEVLKEKEGVRIG